MTRSALPSALALSVFVLLSGCSSQETPPAPSAKPAMVIQTSATPVVLREFETRLRVEGVVTQASVLPVVAQTTGVIQEVLVDVGEIVEPGRPLVRLDDREAREQLRVQLAELTSVRAQQAEQARVVQEHGVLHAKGYLSTRELDRARTALKSLSAQTDAVQARVEAAQRVLANTALVAEHRGEVLSVPAKEGGYARAGDVLLSLAKPGAAVEVVFQLPERVLKEVQPGARIVAQAGGQTLEGRLTRIQAAIGTGARTFEGYAVFDGVKLLPGQSVTGELVTAQQALPAVPEQALVLENQTPYVFAVADGKVRRLAVQRLQSQAGWVALDGVAPGQVVAVSGGPFLRDGGAVEVLP